ncbi:MAG: hypothetical protein WCJ71_07890 [Candidatus Omnitrophota bacterium]
MKIEISNRLLVLWLILIALAIGTFFVYTKKEQKVEAVGIHITDAKMTTGLDEQLMPLQVTDVFPRTTKLVYCWFSWADATPKMGLKASWNYTIDDIRILLYDVQIPRRAGSGGISLTMPDGKVFPVGAYRLDFIANGKILRSLTFKVK